MSVDLAEKSQTQGLEVYLRHLRRVTAQDCLSPSQKSMQTHDFHLRFRCMELGVSYVAWQMRRRWCLRFASLFRAQPSRKAACTGAPSSSSHRKASKANAADGKAGDVVRAMPKQGKKKSKAEKDGETLSKTQRRKQRKREEAAGPSLVLGRPRTSMTLIFEGKCMENA